MVRVIFRNGGFPLTHVGVWGKRLLEITKVDWNHLLKGGCMVRVQKIYFAKKISIWLNRLDQVISIKYYYILCVDISAVSFFPYLFLVFVYFVSEIYASAER